LLPIRACKPSRPTPRITVLSLSQTLSGWQLIENQAILLWDEGIADLLVGRLSLCSGRGQRLRQDLDVAAASKRPAAGCSKKISFRTIDRLIFVGLGYKLANDGVDTRTIQGYLGHKSIQHTVRYTELAPTRFKGLWRD